MSNLLWVRTYCSDVQSLSSALWQSLRSVICGLTLWLTFTLCLHYENFRDNSNSVAGQWQQSIWRDCPGQSGTSGGYAILLQDSFATVEAPSMPKPRPQTTMPHPQTLIITCMLAICHVFLQPQTFHWHSSVRRKSVSFHQTLFLPLLLLFLASSKSAVYYVSSYNCTF